jgi:hypothetical protein
MTAWAAFAPTRISNVSIKAAPSFGWSFSITVWPIAQYTLQDLILQRQEEQEHTLLGFPQSQLHRCVL